MTSQIIIAFVAYFLILLVIGVVSHRRQVSNEEFIVGNRSLNYWVTALSAHASDMSAWIFMGLPMAVYLQGLSGTWIAIGLFIGMFLNWHFVAAKLRVSTENFDSFTLSTFFEHRFSDRSGILRLITAAMLLFFLTHYLSAALIAMGLLIESVFGIDYYLGLTFATLVVVAYTFGGGFITIAWTDMFQAVFLLLVIMLVPLLALLNLDPETQSLSLLDAIDPSFFNPLGDFTPQSFLSAIFLSLAWGLGYFGMPHVITKFMGIRNVSEMKNSKYLGMSWQFLALSASICIGIVGAAYFQKSLPEPQLVFVELVKRLFPAYIMGFILCGVLAANLSTMDSQLLVCASVIGEDLYKKFYGEDIPQKNQVRASRAGVIIVSLTALLISFGKNETVLDTVQYAWAGLGSSFGPLVLMSLYSAQANKYGAIAGVLTGGLIASLWPALNPHLIDFPIPSMLPGFFCSAAVIYLVSIATGGARGASQA